MNRRKFEFTTFDLTPDQPGNLTKLNEYGAEGWWPVAVLQGALHDDVGHGRVLMVREKDDRVQREQSEARFDREQDRGATEA